MAEKLNRIPENDRKPEQRKNNKRKKMSANSQNMTHMAKHYQTRERDHKYQEI